MPQSDWKFTIATKDVVLAYSFQGMLLAWVQAASDDNYKLLKESQSGLSYNKSQEKKKKKNNA